MNYLHSPSRHHRLNSKSPMSLFDSPSLSGQRYSDPYQALSCESPPPNFDHLQTPLQPPRRTLEWGSDITDKRTSLNTTTPTNTYVTDLHQTTPRRSSLKSPASYSNKVTPTRPTTESLPTATNYKSPMERTQWSERSTSASPVKRLETTPTRYHIGSIPTSLSSTPQQQQHENTSPMNNSQTGISSPLKLMTSTELLYNKSPLDSGARHDIDNSYRTIRRPLEYIRSPIRNMADNTTNNYIYDNTISPVRSIHISSSKKTPTPTKSTPVAATTPKSLDNSPKPESPYQRRLSFDAVSPLVDSLYHDKTDDAEDVSRPVTVTTYRSPVYSNSSYKQSDRQSKTPINQPSPIATSSTGTHYIRPVSLPSPIQPARYQQNLPMSLYDQQEQQLTDKDRTPRSSPHEQEQEQHVHHYSPSKKQHTEDRINGTRQPATTNITPSPENRITSSSTTAKQPQRQPVALPHQHHSQDQRSKPANNVAPKSPVTHHRSYRADLPHYMRTTESYQSRLQAQADDYHHAKLHKTKLGGVTKKTHSPRIQPFRSTTKINALDDIKNEMAKNEMTPEEVYISLAERVKQFEKGLGNGGNSTSTTHHHHTSNADHLAGAHGLTQAKSPYLRTRERSENSSYHRHDLDEPQPTIPSSHHRLLHETQQQDKPRHFNELSNRPHIKRQRSATTSVKDDNNNGEPMVHKSKKRKHQHSGQVKPFHFASDDRAARYQQTFRAKLNLWKEKDLKDKRQ